MKQKTRVMSIWICLVLLSLFFQSAQGQSTSSSISVSIDEIFFNRFPLIESYISITDIQGFPVMNLTENDFLITEDGKPIDDFSIEPYQSTEETLAVVIAIDTSGSMKSSTQPSPMDNSVAAAKEFIAQLNPQDYVGVITFADEVDILVELTNDKSRIPSQLDELVPNGSTAIHDAIVSAINMLQNRSERRAIILLTDGKEDRPHLYTFDQALALATSRAIPIYPVGFGSVDENQLKKLAEVTGGAEQIQPDSDMLNEAFINILNVFRQKYHILMTSNIKPDELEHDLLIGVNYQGGYQSGSARFTARQPVIVKITSPAADKQMLSGEVVIDAMVDALNPIRSVDFFFDDELIQSSKSAPFTAALDSTQFGTGMHTIRVMAEDELGFSDEVVREITIELQRNDWIFWLVGIVVLIALAIFVSLGLRRRQAPPAVARKAVLVEIEGLNIGKAWPLDKDETTLGRKVADNDIGLKGTSASRNHAIIQRTRIGYIASCLKSANPLIVNDEKVERATLQDGDVLKMGESTFRFEYRGQTNA